MMEYQNLIDTLALTLGASWASGINLYAAILMLGVSSMTGAVDLPPDLQILANPLVLGAAGLMYVVEFVADKVPGIDSGWDAVHTFVRIPAGALLAAGAVGDVSTPIALSAAIMGGGLATVSHATKAGSRVAINSSPEPFSNWTASITEDVAVFGGLWAALHHPWIFLGLLVLFILLAVWLLPKIWRGIKRVFSFLGFNKDQDKETGDQNTSGEVISQLERLDHLRRSDAISEDEFQVQKKRLLEQKNS